MTYQFIKDLIELAEEFEANHVDATHQADIDGFKRWIYVQELPDTNQSEPHWTGKENGRSAESVISTTLLHLNRYAKNYSKSAIYGSAFSTQEDFIYLINLKTFGPMTKVALVKKNVHDKTSGMQVINRLISNNWVAQSLSDEDKRSKVINITELGLQTLEKQMDNIRLATKIVSGNLSYTEKMELIRLLAKLDDFHEQIFHQQINTRELLDVVNEQYKLNKN